MKNKILSILLCFFLIFSLFIPSETVFADDNSDSGMEISKTASDNNDGTYTIELEAYATGEKVITEIKKDIPTDIVLVLDQSGSMTDPFSTFSFEAITGNNRRNSNLFNRRHNGGSGNLWHKLDDGSYVSVSVIREVPGTYTAITNQSNSYYNNNSNKNRIYHLKDGVYYQVTVERSWSGYTYTYKSDAGLDVTSTSSGWGNADNTIPNFGTDGPLYLLSNENLDQVKYTYSYTDANNNTQTIGTSTGQNTNFTNPVLYQRNQGSITRLQALKNALNVFVNQVNEKAKGEDGSFDTEDDIDHRIAVVGFASGQRYNNVNYNYGNTEIFIGANEYRYGTAAQGVYGTAFQDMSAQNGRNNVNASINALTADGGTLTDLGMEMANGILNANPVQNEEQRNRVVVVFTDGVPGWSGYDSTTADAAINEASTTKNTHGATVYTVGIFDGADATSPGNTNGTEDQKANWFMQNLSSNNGAVQNPSYYLSAADADSLTNIFKQIADQIESGGSETTLSEETVIKDIIAPAFTLPPGTTADNITLKSYNCTGIDGNGDYTWSQNSDALGATAVIGSTDSGSGTTTDNQLSITGFDFSGNWVGTETDVDGTVSYRGNKLVISFIVTPREGFFGGNDVFTNSFAGIYEDADAENPVLVFDRPVVDVSLASIEINIPDSLAGSYFGQPIPEEALKMHGEVKIGGQKLDFDEPNFGLEPWQNEYVDIETVAEAVNGSLEDVREDIEYTLTVTVKPKNEGSIEPDGASATGTSSILVFKPKLTYKDSDVYYGDNVPSYGADNLVSKTWVHTSTGTEIDHTDMTMLNAEPDLGLSYTLETGTIVDGKVATKQDIKVKTDVTIPVGTAQTITNINNNTIFIHQPCSPACEWTDPTSPGDPAFLLHVKTGQLTITKSGGNADEPYVFDIYKDGVKYTEATILGNDSVTIYELPVGTYSIQEDTGWSWRFNPGYSANAILSKDNFEGSLTCTNTANNNIYWLNGYSEIVKNIFGVQP